MNIGRKIVLLLCFIGITSCYKPVLKPADFDDFWDTALRDLKKELIYETVRDTTLNGKKVELVKIKSFQNKDIYSWLSTPLDSGKFTVYIKYSSFGKGNQSQNNFPDKWFLLQRNRINLLVDIRGQGLSTDQIQFEGYLTKGLENEQSYIYRGAYLDAVKAIDFAAVQSKGNGNIITMGNDQGGALAIVGSALNKKVTLCVAGYPMFTDMYHYDKTKWPMKIWLHHTQSNDLKLEDLHKTLSYFDVLNFADRIDAPVFLKAQENDTVTPKEGIIKLYDLLKTEKKQIYIDSCRGHKCSLNSAKANEKEKIFIKEILNK